MKTFWIGFLCAAAALLSLASVEVGGVLRTDNTARVSSIQSEVYVGLYTDAGCTVVPATGLVGRHSVEIFNNGPNKLYCTPNSTCPAVGTARPIAAAASWALDVSDATSFRCVADTASQVDGGTTFVTEIR